MTAFNDIENQRSSGVVAVSGTSATGSETAASPIGIFDSGVGGLSVLREVRRQLPSESVHYIADTANCPYGDKPIEVVCDLALKLTDRLIHGDAKIVIMASGTSTAAGLETAQAQFSNTTIVGTIESGARAAVARSDGPIGIIATNATTHSLAFTHAIRAIDSKRVVVEQGCPRFVPLVETGETETPDALDAALEYLRPLHDVGAQTIVLGCTHFPFLMSALMDAAKSLWRDRMPVFVDPAAETVLEVGRILAVTGRLSRSVRPDILFDCTGDPEDFAVNASLLLRAPVTNVRKLVL